MRRIHVGLLAVALLGPGTSVLAQDDDQVARQSNRVVFHIEGMT